ncbi:MAG TPA: autotransporter domain-containing protein, partial [Xylella sp.]
MFPVTYSALNNWRTSGYVGADVTVQLTLGLKWMAGLEGDLMLNGNDAVCWGRAGYIGCFTHEPGMKRMMGTGTMTSGVEYSLNSRISLWMMLGVSSTAPGESSWSGTLSLGG